ncbi:hypothetical protein NLK61_01170 [Pseudomonas fuscovaginae UPB0736]|uniref:hypothetical protein n=1 Tax=Pseudomonas asplenii TaxID=53407 RepID=UPI000287AB02|nr:hypothetical protein [Pseudomonas fuscovaginae]UUQ65292.1 hypothetical protein NLK61_01170 [Pseudomonas fuscovaginae UPB0736]
MGSVFGSLRFGAAVWVGVVLTGCAEQPATLEQWGGYEPQARNQRGNVSLHSEKALFSEPESYMDLLLSNAQTNQR